MPSTVGGYITVGTSSVSWLQLLPMPAVVSVTMATISVSPVCQRHHRILTEHVAKHVVHAAHPVTMHAAIDQSK